MARAGLGDGSIDAGQIGFRIAPRINAAGRMEEAMTALELLMSDDEAHTSALADRLEDANDLRREEEARTLREALDQLGGAFDPAKDFGVVLEGEGWHPGVIGITEDIDQTLDGRGGAAERVAAGGDDPADPDPRQQRRDRLTAGDRKPDRQDGRDDREPAKRVSVHSRCQKRAAPVSPSLPYLP